MTRRIDPQLAFDALSLEGALLPAEWLAKAASLEAPAQSPADYGIPKGLQLRDEIGRYWRIAGALWAEFAAARSAADKAGVTRRFVCDLLSQAFGFVSIETVGERGIGDRVFPVDFEARDGRVPILVGPHDRSLDQSTSHHGDEHRRRSAWGALQEYLNAAEGALWGIASNGVTLRVGRDNTSLTRPAWLEADLERIFTEDRYADFSVLWLVLHASRFGRRAEKPRAGQSPTLAGSETGASLPGPSECPLELWREAGLEEGSRARDSLRLGVEQALLSLGDGFLSHPANSALRDALAGGELSPAGYFNELLRVVYRMIFLLTVEERGILHPPGVDPYVAELYAAGYGMRRLRERSLRHSARDRHGDLWLSLRPVFAGLGRAEGEPALGLPGMGGLFESEQCPHLDLSTLSNRSLLAAVFRLAWLPANGTLARVNWKDMGVEEFGSVYESLLELVPVLSDEGRHFQFAGSDESAGNARKLSGSYYTPDSLVQQLLDTALEPVVAERLSQHSRAAEQERALLSLSILDPACGSGHFLLAAARRLAGHLARLRSGGTPGADEYRHALRDVVTHCVYGVDRNPMALELARIALWLEAYTPDRALGYLDHHLVCGDALLGLLDLSALREGIPDDAYEGCKADNKAILKSLRKLNREGRLAFEKRAKEGGLLLELGAHSLAEAFSRLEQLADDGVANVAAKRAQYAALRAQADTSSLALAADLVVAAFIMPKRLAENERALTDRAVATRFPTTATLATALEGTLTVSHSLARAAREACNAARVLHWPLAFPRVFELGGFDVVVGNPPWEMLQTDAQEFFAGRDTEIATAPTLAKRQALIEGRLKRENPRLYSDFREEEARVHRIQAFVHGSGRYPKSAVGRINLASLFAETSDQLRAPAARAGLVLPSGIATDSFTQQLFRHFADGRLVSLYDFENRDGIFPSVDSRYKFCLLTLGRMEATEFVFFVTQVEQIHDVHRRFRLSADDFRLLNPNTLTCPVFRSEIDAELTKKIYRKIPVLIDETKAPEEGNPWRVSFMLMFMMNTDSHLFLDVPEHGAVPLYEAKMIHQFDHRWATYDANRRGGDQSARDVTDAEKSDPSFSVRPRYWVRGEEVKARLEAKGWKRGWLMGWRDICRATDERTVIASVIPRAAVGNNLPLMLMAPVASPSHYAALLGNLCCMVLDFVARQKVGGTHLNFFIYKQLPVLPPDAYPAEFLGLIARRVLELTYTACDLAPWAGDLGFAGPPFAWDAERRARLRAELDACYAKLYGLTRDELRYVLDPADAIGSGYPSETFRVLKDKEERDFGEYRTRRLVLEAYDALTAGRPMPSDIPATQDVAPQPGASVPPRPQLEPSLARGLAAMALVRAAGGTFQVSDLARAFMLRSQPSELARSAPADWSEVAEAWARAADADPLPAGAFLAMLNELVDRQALRWQFAATGERLVVATDHTLTWNQLGGWFHNEARLLLGVLRAMPEVALRELDDRVPSMDRARLRAHTA